MSSQVIIHKAGRITKDGKAPRGIVVETIPGKPGQPNQYRVAFEALVINTERPAIETFQESELEAA